VEDPRNQSLEALLAQFTAIGSERVHEVAETLLPHLYEAALMVVKAHVLDQHFDFEEQLEAGVFGEGPFEWKVESDHILKHDDTRNALSILLSPDPYDESYSFMPDGQYLKVYVPVGRDVRLDESFRESSYFDPEFKPPFIVFELYEGSGIPQKYVIYPGNRTEKPMIKPYIDGYDAKTEVIPEEGLENMLPTIVSSRISPLDSVVLDLAKHLHKWDVESQGKELGANGSTANNPENDPDFPDEQIA
jgi:hypothetical protein